MTEQYEHHGKNVFVRSELKGKHRDYCLCFICSKFNIENKEKSCKIANALYAFDCEHNLTTPVFECAEYKPIR